MYVPVEGVLGTSSPRGPMVSHTANFFGLAHSDYVSGLPKTRSFPPDSFAMFLLLKFRKLPHLVTRFFFSPGMGITGLPLVWFPVPLVTHSPEKKKILSSPCDSTHGVVSPVLWVGERVYSH